MKIVITNSPKIEADNMVDVHYNIVEGDEVLVADQSIKCFPTEAINQLRSKLNEFAAEYQAAQALTEGMEIE